MADLYRHKEGGSENEVMRHDGTDEQAEAIHKWVEADAGDTKATVISKGTLDFDLDNAYVLIERELDSEYLRPYFYLIRARVGRFYVVFDGDFHEMYEKVGA